MTTPHLFIGFENEPYFPGQEVTGVVVLVVTEPVKAVSLEVRWRGMEYVSWTEAIQRNVVERERILFDSSQRLWPKPISSSKSDGISREEGEESGEESIDLEAEPARTSFRRGKEIKTYGGDRGQTLQPGTYTYHLKWRLPRNLPLSFEDETSAKWMSSEGAIAPKMLSKGQTFIRYYATASLVICKQTRVKVDASMMSQEANAFSVEKSRLEASSAKSDQGLEGEKQALEGVVVKLGSERVLPQEMLKEVTKSISAKKHFKVLEDIPLMALTGQPPLIAAAEKTFLFGADAPLRMTITLENGGIAFVGSSFYATIGIENKSSRTVDGVRIGVDCITTFRVAPPVVAPVVAGLAGSQVQSLHPTAIPPHQSPSDYIENVTRRENILNTTLSELTNIQGSSPLKASRISVSLPSFWPGSIVSSVHVERRYELFAEAIITMGTNLTVRCPLRLLEWCDFFSLTLPHLASSILQDSDLEDFDISDDSADVLPSSSSSSSAAAAAAHPPIAPSSSSSSSPSPSSQPSQSSPNPQPSSSSSNPPSDPQPSSSAVAQDDIAIEDSSSMDD
jgi:hypothetical protein